MRSCTFFIAFKLGMSPLCMALNLTLTLKTLDRLVPLVFKSSTRWTTHLPTSKYPNSISAREEATHFHSEKLTDFHRFLVMSVCRFAENVHILLSCPNKMRSYFNLLCVLICFLNAGSHLCFGLPQCQLVKSVPPWESKLRESRSNHSAN